MKKWIALALIGVFMVYGCASTAVGKATQTADVQKQLVERAAVEFIKLKKSGDARITDAVYASARNAYENWAVAQGGVAQALASWKTVSSDVNEQKLMAALNEVVKHVDAYLAIVGRFVDLEKIKKTISDTRPAPVTKIASWSDAERLAGLYVRQA